jgi:hypothetical protein
MNFVVKNSNKLQRIGFRRENELSVFTLGANNTCPNNTCYVIYLWRKVVCFVLSEWYIPNHSVLGYVMAFMIRKFSMNRGASTWFTMFGVMVQTLLIIEPFFHWIFKKKPRLKTILEYGGILGYYWKALT